MNEKNDFKQLSDYIIKKMPFTKVIFDRFPWIMQFINFSIVGVINLILSYSIYAILIYFKVHHQLANQASFWISVLNGYFMNRFWVFKKQAKEKSHSQTIKYFIVYGFNFFLGIFLMYVFVDILNLNKYIIPFLSLPMTVPMNYCLNKFWVFKKNNKGD